jgi:Flp pilus assembly secretin CpaC
MKLLQLKPTILVAAILSVSAYTGLASAHCFNGSTLGTAAKAADLYQVMCFNNGVGVPARLDAIPNLTAGGSGVMVTVAKPNFLPITGSDTTNGAAITLATCTGASLGTTATLNGGAGNYDILVQKNSVTSDVTAKTYGLVFHCETAAGVETGTAEVAAGAGGLVSPAPGDIDFLINQ